MALLRPPLPAPAPAPLLQLSTATATATASGASRLQPRIRCRYSFNDRGPLPNAPPLYTTLSTFAIRSSSTQLRNVVSRVAKVFGPAIFEASKLDVIFLEVTEDEHRDDLPRIYTLTHCDITAMLTLTISKSVNKAQLQGWYKRLQRDDVVAMWMRCQGSMSLHVHCHISDGHWFRDALARLRFHIFKKELPVVLEAFRHGDQALFIKHPGILYTQSVCLHHCGNATLTWVQCLTMCQAELEKAPVWVNFHSNVKEFNKVECWGPLQLAGGGIMEEFCNQPVQCRIPCDCCFPR